MLISVDYKDTKGIISNRKVYMSNLAMVKHIVMAGQGMMPHIDKYRRSLGVLLMYSDYFPGNFSDDHFNALSGFAYDPTVQGQFSNLVGKAMADFLAKRISGAKITYNYEAVMKLSGLKVKNARPDLLGDTGKEMFALEAKGYKYLSFSDNEMKKVKHQAKSGYFPVGFEIASVTYGLYSNIKVKYYDPKNEFYQYDKVLSKKLVNQFYSGVLSYIDERYFVIDEVSIENNQYYKLTIQKIQIFNVTFNVADKKISILINKKIEDIVQNSIEEFDDENTTNFSFENEKIYIDSDGIGLIIENEEILADLSSGQKKKILACLTIMLTYKKTTQCLSKNHWKFTTLFLMY